ncbi:MAG: leucine-rich repeat protein [Clostridia bacterium]|nr:leucine-rich repeat protein [Clostridia bacterium]
MSGKYSIVYSLEKNLYKPNSPVVIKAGALVLNTENGRLHVQVRFQNVSDKKIVMLKAKFKLFDAIAREREEVEYQYLDLTANYNDDFCGKIPVAVNDSFARKFSADVLEVCFEDGSVWNGDDEVWSPILKPELLQNALSEEAISEFIYSYCTSAVYVPYKHEDLWICSCGAINHEREESCANCSARYDKIATADNDRLVKEYRFRQAQSLLSARGDESFKRGIRILKELDGFNNADTLWKDYVYHKALAHINIGNSDNILEGIDLLREIESYKDSLELIKKAEKDYEAIKKVEEEEKERKLAIERKKRKRAKFLILMATIAFVAIIAVVLAVHFFNEQDRINRATCKLELNETKEYYVVTGVEENNFTEIVLPKVYNGKIIKEIANNAFASSNITSITIPTTVEKIGASAFENCDNLVDVIFQYSSTLQHIGDRAFYNCHELSRIDLGNTKLVGISKKAFYNTDLVKIKIPDTVKYIDDSAFELCSKLDTVEFSSSLVSIGKKAFEDCNKLINVSISSPTLDEIGYRAFFNCISVKTLNLVSVKKIGANAFSYCRIEKLSLPEGVETIGDKAFFYNNVESLEIPSSLQEIGNSAFEYCNLSEITFKENSSLTNIGSYAFDSCEELKTVHLPISLEKIGYEAFNSCDNLEYVYFEGTSQDWSGIDADINTQLDDATILYGYDGKIHTYSFVSNGGGEIDDIVSDSVINLPTPTKRGYVLLGWCTNPDLSGEVVSDLYYDSANVTLYAKWVLEAEHNDGSSMQKAITVGCGKVSVNISNAGSVVYYKFVPNVSREYIISSSGDYDTYGYVYYSSGVQKTSNNNGGDGSNFSMSTYLERGETYYIAVGMYSSLHIGTFKLVISY